MLRPLLFSWLIQCLFFPAQTHAAAYEAQGVVNFYNYLNPTNARKPAVNFSVSVSNDCWLVRLTPLKATAFEYQEAAYDGQTLYHLIRLNLSHGGKASTGNVATAWIYDNQEVVYDIFGHQIGAIWLMLASAGSFQASTNGMVVPAVTFGLFEIEHYHERPFKQHAKWRLQREFPGLPLDVAYMDDGEVKTSPQFPTVRRKPPFDLGFTNVVYRVTSLTNCGGIQVPWSAELCTFKPSVRGKPELVPFTRYEITLTSWSNDPRLAEFRPQLPGLTVIGDARVFQAVGNHSHLSSEKWPALAEVTNAPGFSKRAQITQAARASSPTGADSLNKRSRIVRTCVLILLIAPIFLAAVAYWKKNQPTNKKEL